MSLQTRFVFFILCLWAAFFALPRRAALAWQPFSPCQTRPGAPLLQFKVVKNYPHDPGAFTEGLLFANGNLYESTGLNNRSSLRKVDLHTGRVLKEDDLPSQFFGEGLAILDGSLFQLTWKNGLAFQYDLHTFALKRRFRYAGEGWGLTVGDNCLIMSNGSSELEFIDPKTFAVKRLLQVRDMGRPVPMLNELEWIKGKIFANVWHKDYILIISPETGQVTGWLDLSALRRQLPPSAEVLNGIAYDAKKDRIFVTGKLWPLLFQIRLLGH